MTDFSLVSYESISVQEYLPILQKIKYDLNLIYEKSFVENTLPNMSIDFATNSSVSQLKNMGYCCSIHTEVGDCNPSCTSLLPETDFHNYKEQLNTIDELVPSKLTQLQQELDKKDATIADMLDKFKLQDEQFNKNVKEKERIIEGQIKITEEKERIIEQIKKSEEKENIIETLNNQVKSNEGQSNDEKEKLIQEKTEIIQNIKKDISNLNSTIKHMTVDHENILKSKEEEISLLKTRIKEHEKIKDVLEHDVQEKDAQVTTLNKKVSNYEILKEDCENKREIIEQLQCQINELCPMKDDLQFKTSYISDLENKIKDLKSSDYSFDVNYQKMVEHLKHKRLEIRENMKKMSNLESALEESEEKLRKMEREYKRQLRKSEEELTTVSNELQDRDETIKSLKQKFKNNDISNDGGKEYLKEIEELKKLLSISMKEKDTFAMECSRLKDNIGDMEMKSRKHVDEMLNKNKTIEDLEVDLENKKKTYKEMSDGLQKKQQAMEVMKLKIKEGQNKIPNQSSEFKILERDLFNKSEELKQMEVKLENYKESLEKKFEENEIQKKEINKIKEELENFKRLKFNENKKGYQPGYNDPQGYSNANKEKVKHPDWWKKHFA